ncbi:MAG: hypothetical protein IJQ81_17635 [Oscillibacter sp.]|nr:hypothetical protein [Oscillibacter sp.]
MNQPESELFIEIDGKRIPVSEQVYREYWRSVNREDYFMRIVKQEGFIYDPKKRIAKFVPGREDSYERLVDENIEFVSGETPLDEQVMFRVMLEHIMVQLSDEERAIFIHHILLEKPERDACVDAGLSRNIFQRRKQSLMKKLRQMYNDSS